MTHSSHGRTGARPNEHPAGSGQHSRRSSTTVLIGVLVVLGVVAGVAIIGMNQTNAELNQVNQAAAVASSTIADLRNGQERDAASGQSANSVISSLQAANQSLSSQLASAEQATTSVPPPSRAGSVYHQAQVTLDVGQDPIDITAPPSDPTWGADASYGPDQRNALSYSARGLRINASHIGIPGAIAADYPTCSSRTDYGGYGYVDTMTPITVFCVRFGDRFGAVQVLESTTDTVRIELTTWEN